MNNHTTVKQKITEQTIFGTATIIFLVIVLIFKLGTTWGIVGIGGWVLCLLQHNRINNSQDGTDEIVQKSTNTVALISVIVAILFITIVINGPKKSDNVIQKTMSSEQEERKITPPTPTTTVTTQKTMSSELKEKVKNAIIEDSTKKDYELIMSVLPKGSQRDDCTVSFLNVESDIGLMDEGYDAAYYYSCKIPGEYEAGFQCHGNYDENAKLTGELDCRPYGGPHS